MKIKDIIIDIVIVAVIVAVFSVFIKPIIVDGESMEPTLRNRDYLFLSRQAYHVGKPKRGQIVVFPVEEDPCSPPGKRKPVVPIAFCFLLDRSARTFRPNSRAP